MLGASTTALPAAPTSSAISMLRPSIDPGVTTTAPGIDVVALADPCPQRLVAGGRPVVQCDAPVAPYRRRPAHSSSCATGSRSGDGMPRANEITPSAGRMLLTASPLPGAATAPPTPPYPPRAGAAGRTRSARGGSRQRSRRKRALLQAQDPFEQHRRRKRPADPHEESGSRSGYTVRSARSAAPMAGWSAAIAYAGTAPGRPSTRAWTPGSVWRATCAAIDASTSSGSCAGTSRHVT